MDLQRHNFVIAFECQTEEVEQLNITQPSGDEMVEVEEDEITITIHREPRQGLGISIAGGKGSSPYKEDDEVSLFYSGIGNCLSGPWKYT